MTALRRAHAKAAAPSLQPTTSKAQSSTESIRDAFAPAPLRRRGQANAMPRLPERGKLSAAKRRGLLGAVQTIERNNEWKSLIMTRHAYITLGLMAGTQTLSAARMVLGAKGAAIAATGNVPAATACLAGAMGAWSLAYLTQRLSNQTTVAWQNAAADALVQRLIELNHDRPDAWAIEAYRKEIETWVNSRGESAVQCAIGVVSSSADLAMGLVAQGTAVACVVSPLMVPALALSAVGTAGYHSLRSAQRQKNSQEVQKAYREADKVRSALCDNVMLGNEHNQTVWREKLDAANAERDRATSTVLRQSLVDDAVKLVTSAALPSGVLLSHAAQSAAGAVGAMAAAPNLFSLLNQYVALTNIAGHWQSVRATMQDMVARTQPGDMGEWNARLKHVESNLELLTVTRNGQRIPMAAVVAAPDLLAEPGRWTIQGPNGTGKSTLLHAIDAYFGRDSLYLPQSSQLFFRGDIHGSSGQVAHAQISELGESQPRILLLDEWDGFLDPARSADIDNKITQWAHDFSVIEVRQVRGGSHG